MTYTGKTSTTFTGITRNTNSAGAAAALDDATVKLASFSDDIFSGFTDQLRNTYAAAAVTSSAPAAGGTLTVGSTDGFPDTGTIKVGNEHMTYTAKTATTFTIGVKAQDNTTTYTGSYRQFLMELLLQLALTDRQLILFQMAFPESWNFIDWIRTRYLYWVYSKIALQDLILTRTIEVTFTGLTRGVNGTTAATGSDNAASNLTF